MIPLQSLLADALAKEFFVESAGRDLSRSVQVDFSGILLKQSLNKQAGKVQEKGEVHFFLVGLLRTQSSSASPIKAAPCKIRPSTGRERRPSF